MSKRTWAAAVSVAVLSWFVGGCDTRGSTGAAGGTVSGTVTLDGEPLKLGVVTFHPVAGGQSALGPVANDGTYKLNIGNDVSIPAGEYLVTVDAAEPAAYEEGPGGAPKPPRPGKRITPDKYAKKETTDLRVTVKAGANEIPLELKSGK